MNILEQAKELRTDVVTKDGKHVKILKRNARGEYPLIGFLSEKTFDRPVSWKLDGISSTPLVSDNPRLWTMHEYFRWSDLPAWANACVYKVHSKWFCSSIAPVWDELREIYVHNVREHCTLELPEVVTRDILWSPSNKNSLSLNPERDEEA